jgi:hypothetical protein
MLAKSRREMYVFGLLDCSSTSCLSDARVRSLVRIKQLGKEVEWKLQDLQLCKHYLYQSLLQMEVMISVSAYYSSNE